MVKGKLANILLALALVLAATTTAFAADTGPIPILPTMKLSVTQSPLTIYPPVMIYTAQLSYVPPTPSALLKVDFYNINSFWYDYLGSALVDPTGKAVLKKQMKPGIYTAISKVIINTRVIWSNKVMYKVL